MPSIANIVRRLAALSLASAPPRAQPPGDADAELLLCRAAYRERRSEEAVRRCERAVALSPDSLAPHLWLGRALVQQLPSVNFLRQPGLARRARAEFDRAVALDPRNVDVREDRATYYLNAPAIAGGGVEKARAEAEVARGLDPYRGALLRGQVETHARNAPAAEAEYAALVRAYPDSAAPFNRLVGAYQEARRFAEAFAAIDARLAVAPDDPWATYQLGRTAALSGERLDRGEAALRRYLRAGRFHPTASEAHAHYRLGMILEHRGDGTGARTEYEVAVRLEPKLEDARRALGRLGGGR